MGAQAKSPNVYRRAADLLGALRRSNSLACDKKIVAELKTVVDEASQQGRTPKKTVTTYCAHPLSPRPDLGNHEMECPHCGLRTQYNQVLVPVRTSR